MAVLKVYKVISALPSTLQPDAIYIVRVGSGYDMYVTDTTGSVAYSSNGSGVSGDTLVSEGALINSATAKATPVDADQIGLMDSAASNILKKLSWSNVKATLKTYFDTLYQAVLVSGTNIKTVNGSSLLGSGDVTVSGGDTLVSEGALINSATAKATPVDADQIGLMDSASSNILKKLSWANVKATLKTYFDTLYQAVLVSGTNIKTVNGSSLLGSGNLTISGGSSGVHAPIIVKSGAWYSAAVNSLSFATTGVNINRLILYPFIPINTITISSLEVSVIGGNTAGALSRILVYSDSAGLPLTKLFESASLDLSTAGTKSAAYAVTLNAGTTYWLAYHTNNVTPSLVHFSQGAMINIQQNTGTTLTSSTNQFYLSVNFLSAPATITQASLASAVGNCVAIFLKQQ